MINDYVMIADSVSIHDNDHVLDVNADEPRINQGFTTGPVVIHRNAWLGSKSCILRGGSIGECSIVTAGAVVKCNVPGKWIYAGEPALAINEIK